MCGGLQDILLEGVNLGEVFGEQSTVPAKGYCVNICVGSTLMGRGLLP